MHDYHVHTHYCRHAVGRLEEYARSAFQRGLTEICFTPHVPLPVFRPGAFGGRLRMDPAEFPRYMEEVEEVRGMFPGLTILAGVEADYVEGTEEYLRDFLSRWPLDLVLMSIHFVRKWPDPWWVFELPPDRGPVERIYDDYLEALQAGAETGLFDCVAHFDLIKQVGAPLLASHRARVERIITVCRDRGMSAEVNVSGIRKAVGEPFPSWEIVHRMVELGLPLVPGADAHEPALVGQGLETLDGLRLVRYRGRRIQGGTAPKGSLLAGPRA
jgi:histidinol-phosphatase (PHP family)